MKTTTIVAFLAMFIILTSCQKTSFEENITDNTQSLKKAKVTPNDKLSASNIKLKFAKWIDKGILYAKGKNEAVFFCKIKGGGDVHELEEISFTFKSVTSNVVIKKAEWQAFDATPQEKAGRLPGDGRFMRCLIEFEKKPQGIPFATIISATSADGKTVMEPLTIDFILIEADANDNLADFEILPTSNPFTFEVYALFKNLNKKELRYANIQAIINNDTKGSVITIPHFCQARKRPELLFEPWDNEIDDYLNEIQNNPLLVPVGNSSVNFEEILKYYTNTDRPFAFQLMVTPMGKEQKAIGASTVFDVIATKADPKNGGGLYRLNYARAYSKPGS